MEEEWQRRKSKRVDSLFLDYPKLSPVPEESRESYDKLQNIPYDDVSDDSSRSYSPLPPLIVEVLPNKHDEPEEYYVNLHKKILKIYRRLFIENRSLCSEEYDSYINSSDLDSLNYNDLRGSNIGEYINNVTESNDSNYSNGNEADCEMVDSETTDGVNEESSNRSDEQEIEDSDMSRADDEETGQTLEYITDDEQVDDENSINHEFNDLERPSNDRSVQNLNEIEDSNNAGINDNNKEDEFNGNSNGLTGSQEKMDYEEKSDTGEFSIENKTNSGSVVNEINLKAKDRTETAPDDEDFTAIEAMDEDVETNNSSEGTDFRQITTRALVHVDGSQCSEDRESPIYEDSVKSVILSTKPVRRVAATREVDVRIELEDLIQVEDNEDPPTILTYIYSENESTIEEIEEMRSQQTYLPRITIPVTHRSDSEISDHPTAILEAPTALTSSSHNGDANEITELKTSDDIHEILNNIFNESKNDNVNNLSISRKRRATIFSETKDISIQTSELVTWDDYSGDIIAGTPKVFRLCACKDHVCR